MNLNHIALTINNSEEITNFYAKILNMKFSRNFTITKNLAKDIFGVKKEITVNVVKNKLLIFELFLSENSYKSIFNHVCISVDNREKLFTKALKAGYSCIRIKREQHDLLFIKDKSENIFELKD